MKTKDVKIGDFVKIVNSLQVFSIYEEMAEFFKMKNWKKKCKPDNEYIHEIINIDNDGKQDIAYIRNIETDDEYMVRPSALELYKEGSFYFKKEEFEI